MNESERAVIMENTFDTDEIDSPFGKRWGSELLQLTPEHVHALQQGKILTVDVMAEYILFIKLAKNPNP